MSANQIKNKTVESYHEQYLKQLVHYGNQNWLLNHYKVGEQPDADKAIHALFVKRMTSTDSCEMIHYLEDVIGGKIKTTDKKRCISDTIREYKKCHKKEHCSDTEVICDNIGLIQF